VWPGKPLWPHSPSSVSIRLPSHFRCCLLRLLRPGQSESLDHPVSHRPTRPPGPDPLASNEPRPSGPVAQMKNGLLFHLFSDLSGGTGKLVCPWRTHKGSLPPTTGKQVCQCHPKTVWATGPSGSGLFTKGFLTLNLNCMSSIGYNFIFVQIVQGLRKIVMPSATF